MIAAVVNVSTNEYPFLKTCLQQLDLCVDQILITVCDHFYDGVPEDREVLEAIYAEFSEYEFLEFAYDPENNKLGPQNSKFWANLSRMIGWYHTNPKIEYLLFLDCE